MKVLGIDPGYGRCGVAIIDRVDGKDIHIFSTCIETSPRMSFPERLSVITTECAYVMDRYKPEHIARSEEHTSELQSH